MREKFGVHSIWPLLKDTLAHWSENKVPKLSAALAFYTAFSMGPLLVILIAVAGIFMNRDDASRQTSQQISLLIGSQGAESVQAMVTRAAQEAHGSARTVIIGIVGLLFGATAVFSELQDSLNIIWGVRAKPNRGVRVFLRTRLLSFGMMLAIGFIFMVSVGVSAFISGMSAMLDVKVVTQISNFIVSLLVIALLFALIYKLLPDVSLKWGDVWVGAGVTALLFALGKFLIGMYLARSAVSSVFGAAGSLALLLLWVYYSAQVIFLGAEMTRVYAKRFGSGYTVAEYAEVDPDAAERENARHPQPAVQHRAAVVYGRMNGTRKSHAAIMVPAMGAVVLGRWAWRRYHPAADVSER